MRRARSAVMIAMSLILSLLLSSCGVIPTQPDAAATPPAAESTGGVKSFENEGMFIALCTTPETVDRDRVNSTCLSAVTSFVVERGGLDSVTPIYESTGDHGTVLRVFGNASASYDLMICVGDRFSGFASAAQAHPDSRYILVDTPCTDESGNAAELDNVYVIEFAQQQAGFLAGVAAAMETETGRVAVITDVPGKISQYYYYGFRSGVAYANGNLGTAAEVIDHPTYAGVDAAGNSLGGNYTLGESGKASALANSLIDEGCDILFSADSTFANIFAAARERGCVKVIGSVMDLSGEGAAGTYNVTLTSVTLDYTKALGAVMSTVVDGSFRGGQKTYSAADEAVGFVKTEDHHQLKAETIAALDSALALMKDGTIVPGTGPQ